jgi:hypothetical protein
MGLMSLAGFAAKLAELTIAVHEEGVKALEAAAVIVETEAKAEIGIYQSGAGPFAQWATLADSTLAEKERLGYAPPDNPLLRTGDMRDGIQHTVVPAASGGTAYVGSDDPVAEYQELGTDRIPPRSFLGGALFRKTDEVKAITGAYVYGALVGRKVHNTAIPVIEK